MFYVYLNFNKFYCEMDLFSLLTQNAFNSQRFVKLNMKKNTFHFNKASVAQEKKMCTLICYVEGK